MKHITNWGIVVTDLAIIFMAVFVSVYTSNFYFLWLLCLMFLTGSCKQQIK